MEFTQKEVERFESDKILSEKLQSEKELKELDSLNKELDKIHAIYRQNNLFLLHWSWSYPNENSKFVDVDITVINPYKQKIKYVWFTFIAFNPVGDPIRNGINGKTEKIAKGIGPIKYGDKGSYNFESVFYSKVIDNIRVKQIKIQFFDGTFKIIVSPREVNKE